MAVTEPLVQAAFDATDGVVPPSAARAALVHALTPLFNGGDPSVTLGPDLSAIQDLTGFGVPRRVADGVWSLLPVDAAGGVPLLDASSLIKRSQLSEVTLSGVVGSSLPELIRDGAAGTVTMPSVVVHGFNNAHYQGIPMRYTTAETTLSVPEGAQYFVACVIANDSTSSVQLVLKPQLSLSNCIPLYSVSRIGTQIHAIGFDTMGCGLPQKQETALLETQPYRRSTAGGLMISEDATRHVLLTPARAYAGTTPVELLAFDSNTDRLVECYHAGGAWAYSVVTQYDNSSIDNGTNKVAMGLNKWKAVWFFRSVGDDKEVFYVNGTKEYNTESAAQVAQRPAIPDAIAWHVIFVGRSIIQNGAAVGDMQSAFVDTFSVAQVSDVTADATSRAANTVYAAPNGSAGVASFRALVAADIPSLDAAKLTSGTLGYARGGTGISAPGATAGNLRWSGSAFAIDTASYALSSAIPAASSTAPAALGTAAVGAGTTWARADHVHAMPTAAQVGAVPSSSGVVGLTLPSSTSFASSFTQDIFGTPARGYFLRQVRTEDTAPSSLLGNYASGLAWKGEDTYGSLMVAYHSSVIRVSGGNGSDPVWTVDLWHTGKFTQTDVSHWDTAYGWGNHASVGYLTTAGTAAAATKLATARTLTIGSTGKSFDGTANVAWSLAEIGAQAVLGYTPVNKGGDTMAGNLSMPYNYSYRANDSLGRATTLIGDNQINLRLNDGSAVGWFTRIRSSSMLGYTLTVDCPDNTSNGGICNLQVTGAVQAQSVAVTGNITGSAKLSSLVVEGRAVISFAGSASMPSGYAVGSIVTVVGGSSAPGVFYSEDGTTFEYSSKTSGFVDGTNVIAMGNLCFQFVKRSATVWRMIGLHPV